MFSVNRETWQCSWQAKHQAELYYDTAAMVKKKKKHTHNEKRIITNDGQSACSQSGANTTQNAENFEAWSLKTQNVPLKEQTP